MNSYNTDIFFSNYYNLQSVHFEQVSRNTHLQNFINISLHCHDKNFGGPFHLGNIHLFRDLI